MKVEAVRIGDSPAAPLLTLITGPSAETRQVGVQKQERAERHDFRHAFWTALLERARGKPHSHSGLSPGTDSWLGAGSGRTGISFQYTIRQHNASVWVIMQSPDGDANARIFDALYAQRDQIEQDFGGALNWDRQENRKQCYIGVTLDDGGYRDDDERWGEIQDRMIETMQRLDHAFRRRIQQLKV